MIDAFRVDLYFITECCFKTETFLYQRHNDYNLFKSYGTGVKENRI